MSFESDIDRYTVKLENDIPLRVLPAFAAAIQESISVGSAITGAPGQPVATGALRASWTIEFLAPDVVRIVTRIEYARHVEDGINRWGPVTYRVGGPHSVKLTLARAEPLLEHVLKAAA